MLSTLFSLHPPPLSRAAVHVVRGAWLHGCYKLLASCALLLVLSRAQFSCIFLMSKWALPPQWWVPCLASPHPLVQLPSDADPRQGGWEKAVGIVHVFTTTKQNPRNHPTDRWGFLDNDFCTEARLRNLGGTRITEPLNTGAQPAGTRQELGLLCSLAPDQSLAQPLSFHK